MDELIGVFPSPFFLVFSDATMVDVTHNATRWYPNYCCAYDYSTDDVVLQKTYHLVDVYVFDYVPEPLDNVLDRFLTYSLEKVGD